MSSSMQVIFLKSVLIGVALVTLSCIAERLSAMHTMLSDDQIISAKIKTPDLVSNAFSSKTIFMAKLLSIDSYKSLKPRFGQLNPQYRFTVYQVAENNLYLLFALGEDDFDSHPEQNEGLESHILDIFPELTLEHFTLDHAPNMLPAKELLNWLGYSPKPERLEYHTLLLHFDEPSGYENAKEKLVLFATQNNATLEILQGNHLILTPLEEFTSTQKLKDRLENLRQLLSAYVPLANPRIVLTNSLIQN